MLAEISEKFIFILEILDKYTQPNSDEKVVIRYLIDYLEKGNLLEEDIEPIKSKIIEISKKLGNYDLRREIVYIFYDNNKKLTKSQKNKIRKIIEILELLKSYIDKKPFKDYTDRDALNIITLKILRLDKGVLLDYNTEVRSISNLALNISGYELKNEIENFLLGRKRKKLSDNFLQKKKLLLETLEEIKNFIEKKENKSIFDYEALFLINLKIYRVEENIIKNFDDEFNSLLSIGRKVGNYKLREKILLIKESIK